MNRWQGLLRSRIHERPDVLTQTDPGGRWASSGGRRESEAERGLASFSPAGKNARKEG